MAKRIVAICPPQARRGRPRPTGIGRSQIHVSKACDYCRHGKRKCDNAAGGCANCRRRGKTCVRENVDRRKHRFDTEQASTTESHQSEQPIATELASVPGGSELLSQSLLQATDVEASLTWSGSAYADPEHCLLLSWPHYGGPLTPPGPPPTLVCPFAKIPFLGAAALEQLARGQYDAPTDYHSGPDGDLALASHSYMRSNLRDDGMSVPAFDHAGIGFWCTVDTEDVEEP